MDGSLEEGGKDREWWRERKVPQNVCLVQKHFLPAYGEPSLQQSRVCQTHGKARFCRTKFTLQNRISQVSGKVHLFHFSWKLLFDGTGQKSKILSWSTWLRYCLLDGITIVLRNFPNFLAVCMRGKTAGKTISLLQKYWLNACGCQRGEERKRGHRYLQFVSLPEPLAVCWTQPTPLGEVVGRRGSAATLLNARVPPNPTPGSRTTCSKLS